MPRLNAFTLFPQLTLCAFLAIISLRAAPAGPFNLDLPADPVSDHTAITRVIGAGETANYATFDGPGCIKRIWVTMNRPVGSGRAVAPDAKPMRAFQNRKIIFRIFFDGATTPSVEAPVGDFFGVMHGVDFYPVNTPFISVKEHNGYECFFEMPFAKSARIEITNGPDESNRFFLQVAWHRYPDQEMKEKRRFSAQWRREMPTARYGNDYLILDADGPGQLIGFFYGVRLIDSVDRWSHGGAENIYIDGLGDQPAYIRGIGGEDTFATSYGGVLHRPESHLYDGIPYYVPEDTGEARSAQRLVGYRFYVADSIHFKKSIRYQFGSMENDIASMAYWYQEGTPRRYVKMPEWGKMLPGAELKAGSMDLALPDDGTWSLGPVLENEGTAAIKQAVKAGAAKQPKTEGKWTKQATIHGFVDFNHLHRPGTKGVGTHHRKKAAEAVAVLDAPADMTAKIRLAWDGHLVLRTNDTVNDFGMNGAFRQRTVEVPLKKGRNTVSVLLSNDTGSNHGGWTFAFRATTPDGTLLVPRAEGPMNVCSRAVLLALLSCSVALGAAARPNVVIILADDLGSADLSSYGATDIKTPAIDSIGQRGMRFTQFYSNSPECTPSRAALLTGRHPQRVGGLECAIGVGNVGRYDEAAWLQQRGELGLPASEISLGQLFKRSGYQTAIFGKWHLGYDRKFSPRQHGFDEALVVLGGAIDYVSHLEQDSGAKVMRHNDEPVEIPGYITDVIADRTVEWIGLQRDQPYFLYVPFTAPHSPFQAPGEGTVTGPWHKGTRASYRGMVEHLDKRVGDILRAIDCSGRANDTIVVFLSDNGGTGPGNNQPLRGGKRSVWEGGIRVPCLVRWPATIKPGSVSGFAAQNIDLTATLLAAARVSVPANARLEGMSLMKILQGHEDSAARRTLYWRFKRDENRLKAVSDGEFKFVNNNGEKALIHLTRDPSEKTNIIDSMPERAAALEAKLTAWEADVAPARLRDFRAETTAKPSAR